MIVPNPHPASDADQPLVDDLRLRLGGSQAGEREARREARRLARELSLARRLLKFYLGSAPPARPVAVAAAAAELTTTLLSTELAYHLDTCEDRGTYTAVSGWAFRPAPGWDASRTAVTLLLRHEDTVYMTPCHGVQRPDVAAFYARQPPEASGGAVGLAGVGFACDIGHDAVPAGVEWKIVLRLECAGRVCEQFTGRFLRL